MSSVFHGGRLDATIAEFGGNHSTWLDLSTGINPNAYPVPEIDPNSWARLPDENSQNELIDAARRYYRVPQEMGIVSGNGTQSIIQNLPQVFLHKTIAIVSPTYEEYSHCWQKFGRMIIKSDSLDRAVEAGNIVVLVNPNNPTAQRYQPDELLDAAQRLASKSGILIVDEAFADCAPELSIVPDMLDNIVVLRSFGKFFGLAGLRLGFAICANNYAEALSRIQGPWSVSGPALAVGTKALRDEGWIAKTRIEIKQNSQAQVEVIEACGLKLIGNAGLFMEFEHSNPANFYNELQKEHILIRAFAERPNRFRFGLCKNMEALERLAFAVKKYV